PWADVSMLRAARSMLGIILRRRHFQRLIRRVEAPTLMVHGEADRLVRHAAAKVVATVRPDWTFQTIADAGHTPMLEKPQETAEAIFRWLDGDGRAALGRATRAPADAPAG
ncbi:MAG TPA: alpha/beta hydrolase, partial [Actinomycetota bacterium]|nr:alpha/beta hydrolase [Actinomycetota bacterium]